MKDNVVIALVGVNSYHVSNCTGTYRFLKEQGYTVRVLTNRQDLVEPEDVYVYPRKIFTYLDKLLFCLDLVEEYKCSVLYLDADKYINCAMRNAALPIFNINIQWVRNYINEYAKLSLIKDCIFPEGSSRSNHRQDQSILTILYYKYKDIYHFQESNYNNYISIHNGKRPFNT